MPTTFGIQAGQAAVNTASGLLGGVFGLATAGINDKRQLRQQDKLNEQAYDINNRMAEENYKREMRKWEETNYEAQMEQLKKAGLNPGLLYGMSGGGGATAQSSGGQGVSAGHAPSGGGEVMSGMGMGIQQGMQLALLDAQRKNIEADTANKNADTANKPLVGENLQASTKSLTQGVENAKALEVLTKVQTDLANIQKEITGDKDTMDAAKNQIVNVAEKSNQEIDLLANQNLIARDTADEKIFIVEQEAIGALLRNNATEVGIKLNEAQIDKMTADILQRSQEIKISGKQADTRRMEYELEKEIRDITDSGRLTFETVKAIGTVIAGGAMMRSGKGKVGPQRTETHQYSEPGYKHTITDKY